MRSISLHTLWKLGVMLSVLVMFCPKGMALQAPDQFLKNVTEQMLSTMKAQQPRLQQNPNRIISIVNRILVPHVEANDMARWVAGRHAWKKATPSQRSRFSQEFLKLMVRTYATSLNNYKNQSIDYMPLRGDFKGRKRIQVASVIREPGRDPIRVNYRLVNKSGQWKVYDIIIEGVSLLKGFQSQFAQDIQTLGIEPVIEKIAQHNRKPLS